MLGKLPEADDQYGIQKKKDSIKRMTKLLEEKQEKVYVEKISTTKIIIRFKTKVLKGVWHIPSRVKEV